MCAEGWRRRGGAARPARRGCRSCRPGRRCVLPAQRELHPRRWQTYRVELRSTRLVGRATECAAISRAVDTVGAGQGGGLVLVGEAGIGKSRLCEIARGHARRQGLLVLSGQRGGRPLRDRLPSAVGGVEQRLPRERRAP
ncbi:MAG: AAA family ATPase [Jiangellaceae bacterium]